MNTTKFLTNRLISYLSNNPMKRIPRMLKIAEKLDKGNLHEPQINMIKKVIQDKDGVWYGFIENIFQDIDINQIKKLTECFFVNATLKGSKAPLRTSEEIAGANIPWAILMDPTSACNLKCTGCWAAEYGDKNNLSYETLDSIIHQANELGIYFFLLSGGEPLIRKKDIIKLCEAHQDSYFFAFTNGTLVDEEFCNDLLRVSNFALAFSIEGNEEATDMRRGQGTYQKVIKAMDLMKKHKLVFGFSTCYHHYNTDSVGSYEFIDDMIARGCKFGWNFTYIPVGKDAQTDLMVTPEQRRYMYDFIHEVRTKRPIFAIDFWNDGEYVQGCVAAGKRYLHINAAGDVEPCAFIHYSNSNIHNVSLLEALKSPVFHEYSKGQPFNDNLLKPCPLLDNPEKLREVIKNSGAKSTDMEAPEDIDTLCDKTAPVAEQWTPVANEIWNKVLEKKAGKQ